MVSNVFYPLIDIEISLLFSYRNKEQHKNRPEQQEKECTQTPDGVKKTPASLDSDNQN